MVEPPSHVVELGASKRLNMKGKASLTIADRDSELKAAMETPAVRKAKGPRISRETIDDNGREV